MKYILLLLLLIGMRPFFVFSQSYNSNCSNTPLMDSIYRNDAYGLAITRLQQTGTSWKDSVDIPVIYRDSLAKAFYAVYNMDASPLKDTLMNLFGFSNFNTSWPGFERDSLHGFPAQGLKEINVTVLNSANWASAWASGNYSTTPNDSVNNLVLNHQIQCIPSSFHIYTDRKIYRLKTPKAINTNALKNKFLAISGVADSYAVQYFGDGNRISATFNSDGIILHFRNGCGDCPAGCTWGRTWNVQVFTNSDCHTQLINSYDFCMGCSPTNPQVCLRNIIVALNHLALQGRSENKKNFLSWNWNAGEKYNQFIIEKSTDGLNFSTIATLPQNNISANAISLEWQEISDPILTEFYRIKGVSQTRGSVYSNILVLKKTSESEEISIFPNPVTGNKFSVVSNNLAGKCKIQIFSVLGKPVWEKYTTLFQNTTTIYLPPALEKGPYWIQLEANQQKRFGKLILQ